MLYANKLLLTILNVHIENIRYYSYTYKLYFINFSNTKRINIYIYIYINN